VKSSNPVLSRLGQAAERERMATHGQAGYGQGPGGAPYHLGEYPIGPPAAQAVERPMTVDDVVVRTVGLLGVTGITAAIAWNIVPPTATFGAWIIAAVVGLVLGLVITFKQITNPAVILSYAVVEGVFVGMISKTYNYFFDGIVLQAVVATFGVFALMAILYKSRVIRATPRFTKILIAAVGGIVVIGIVNLVLYLGFGYVSPLRDGGPIAIGFSILCIVVAALTFVLDFHQIEEGVRYGLPQRFAWLSAFGILVGLVWLYLEILRLLSYLQGSSRD
jgi:uncharacterized YccA/Bax inhibitor family protein